MEETEMNDLVPWMEKPQLPVKWDYQKSVKKVKAFIEAVHSVGSETNKIG